MEEINLNIIFSKAFGLVSLFAISVSRSAPHLKRHLGHALDDAPTEWAHLNPKIVDGTLSHVFGEVRAPLEFRENQKNSNELLQVSTSRW